MLQEGDIWLSKRTKPDGRPYQGLYWLRVRVWRNGAWRDNGLSWGFTELIDQNENKGLLKIAHRPPLAMYTGVYRYEKKAVSDKAAPDGD